jgi:hypothetical protein
LITDGSGKSVGYLRVKASSSGSFTGKVELEGKSYTLLGRLDAHGRFKGTAHGDDGSIEVEFTIDQETGTSLSASFEGGEFNLDLSVGEPREVSLASWKVRYTVDFPADLGRVRALRTAATRCRAGLAGRASRSTRTVRPGSKASSETGAATPREVSSWTARTDQFCPSTRHRKARRRRHFDIRRHGERHDRLVREESDATFNGEGFRAEHSGTGGRLH